MSPEHDVGAASSAPDSAAVADPSAVVVTFGGTDPDVWRRVLGSPSLLPADVARKPNVGWASLPNVEWVFIAESGVIPEPHLLRLLAAGLGPSVTAAYCDFAIVDERGVPLRRVSPGAWSVERSRWSRYTGPGLLVRRGMLPPDGDASRLLRSSLLEASRRGEIVHIPAVGYNVPDWQPSPVAAAERADMLAAAAAPYSIRSDNGSRHGSVPPLSVVIPTRCASAKVRGAEANLLDLALRSITDQDPDRRLQYVLVVDDDADEGSVRRWQRLLGDSLIAFSTPGPFNFAAKVNAGVGAAEGAVVAILNDDMELITPAALQTLALVAAESDVGAVGALLRYEDGTIQHAGQAFADDGVHHVGRGRDRAWEAMNAEILVDRDVSGVTAACLVQRREVWQETGGFDPLLPVSFNDVEYCWRLRQRGLRVVQCNSVELFHFESRTRPGWAQDWEVERLRSRLGTAAMTSDAYTARSAIDVPRAPMRGLRRVQRWRRAPRGR